LSQEEAETLGQSPKMPGWYLHDSRHLIGLGTRAAPVLPGQESRLTARELENIIWNELLSHPRLSRQR
ncbi:MAG: hypothetical protein JWO84_219, partial [Parcubacteria group bacterium]|nr:hypothetical protein [Parcubacteria group bacterium]